MAVMTWLSNMRDPDVSARNAKLYEDAKQGQADYLAKLAGIKKTGAETRGAQIRNEGDALALSQQKALNGLFAKHFDPETQQLDAQGFSRDAMAAGILSPDAMQTPMKTTAGTLATGAAAAKSAYDIKSYDNDASALTAQPQAKKPSGAPAAPTTSTPQAGFQAFANTLGGVAQEPAPYDPTKDVQEISSTFDKSLPAERKALASKQLSGMGAPNMQAALAAEAERFLGVMPKKTDYPGKQAEYKVALLERQARERGLKAHLQGFAGGIVPAGLATAAGIQAKDQSAATFEQGGKLTGWSEAGVPERSMPEAVATEAKRDLAVVRTLEDVASKLGGSDASDDQIRDLSKRLIESGVDVNSVLGLNKSLGKSVADEGLRKGGATWLYSQLRGNRGEAATLLKSYVSGQKSKIKNLIKTSAPGVDLKKLESYIGGGGEIKTYTSPKDPEFVALPKGSRFRGPDGKVRVK